MGISNKVLRKLNEVSLNSMNIEDIDKPLKDGYELFNIYGDIESDTIDDFANRWNNVTGDPDSVRRERIKIINPAVVKFVEEYGEDLKADWDNFYDIMEDNNYHTALFAIEKELQKYE